MLAVAAATWVAVSVGARPAELRWDAPAGCPDAAFVRERLGAYLAESGDRDHRFEVDGIVRQNGESWELSLTTRTEDGTVEIRELRDTDCEGLAESAAVLAAIALTATRAEPSGREGADPSAPPVEVSNESTPASPLPSVSEPSAERRPTDRTSPMPSSDRTQRAPSTSRFEPSPRWSARMSAGGSAGWLPPGADIGVALTTSWRRVHIEVAGSYGPRRRVRFSDLRTAGADVSGWSVGAAGCGVLVAGLRVTFPLCVGFEAGQAIARPVALLNARPAGVAWAAATLSPNLRVALNPRFALLLEPQVQITVVRPTLEVGGQTGPLFESSPASGRLRLGLEVRFW